MVRESPSEGQALRVVVITPQARDEPERITIIFGPGGIQSAEQVWISVLGFMQAMHNQDAEDWLLGEAGSTSIGGYHARQIPFRYAHVESETHWQGLVAGLVRDSMNYAFVTEALAVGLASLRAHARQCPIPVDWRPYAASLSRASPAGAVSRDLSSIVSSRMYLTSSASSSSFS